MTGAVEKDETHVVVGADVVESGSGCGVGLVDGVWVQVGQLDGFAVAPYRLDGVEVVGVAR